MGLLSMLLGAGCADVSPEEVKEKKRSGDKLLLVDVRMPHEHAVRKIEGAKLIPLPELGSRYKEIPQDKDVVVYCQNGIRSIMACRFLKKQGYSRVKNMSGGISRW